MPWKVSGVVNERMNFVVRVQEGERISDLCREFGISRKTGYKFLKRYERLGAVGLYDERRVAERLPHKVAAEVEQLIVETRHTYPTWGARKLKAWLQDKKPGLKLPAESTISAILKRQGLVSERRNRRRRTPPSSSQQPLATAANTVWCCDFKGQFRLGNSQLCYPLTVTDLHSRYLLTCEALVSTRHETSQTAFEWAFRDYGLPNAILSDNGVPFATTSLLGLSKLSVWWKRLGITHHRIQPGHPEQNGAHERMHLTLKRETTRPAAGNLLQQQERFDRFREVFNTERPHEALELKTPASCYAPSPRAFPSQVPEPQYPLHDFTRRVSKCGHITMGRGNRAFLSPALANELVGFREVEEDVFLLSFADLDLGLFDLRVGRFQPGMPNSTD